ncbi:MAG: cytochrome c biogenesis protein CcsA [Berryella intestinalis]|uniref:cytochrome c biogenesis protein CcsA n=1 Tax=Berryella intestinalis TaxID=1531429 RepID=UPI002A7560A5|nr:cytochrome c biogenesis protein CcsA [Berryella intestinalis]MDY3129951.1 cytochrome c biogenesis protein CcsA [Berryella intestinalis]
MSKEAKGRFRVPEAGQWPDRLVVFAAIAGAVLTTLAFLDAFFLIAPVHGAQVNGFEYIGGELVTNKLLLSQKIFFFHMPVAVVSFVALTTVLYYSVQFLRTKEQRFDTCAKVGMEVSLIFVIGTMITGDLWTRFEWGVWWTWDPRLTTYLILMLLCIAYFVLRNSIDEPERRATYSAVIGIIAFVDAPITMMITRFIPDGKHPVVVREGGMTPEMALCVALALIGMVLIMFALYRLRFRQVRMAERVEALKQQLED